MPAPKITINSVQLQKAFDAIKEYLDGDELLRRDGLEAQLSGGPGIRIRGSSGGRVSIEGGLSDLQPEVPWQLLRIDEKLYVLPGLVQYKEDAEAEYTNVTPHMMGGTVDDTSLTAATRPYWTLPLTTNGAAYTVYLVVDVSHTTATANVWLIEDDEDDIQDHADATSHVIVLHEFITTTATSYGTEGQHLTKAGYPELTVDSARFRSDVFLGSVASSSMYDVQADPEDTNGQDLRVVPGLWTRHGKTAKTSIVEDNSISVTPSAEGAYRRYVYALLLDSRGKHDLSSGLTDDLDFMDTGSIWDGTGNVYVFIKAELVEKVHDPFKQFQLLAQVDYLDGELLKITQIHRGMIVDTCPKYNMGDALGSGYTQAEEFCVGSVYTDPSSSPTLKVTGGVFTTRNNAHTISDGSFTDADVSSAYYDIYASTGYDNAQDHLQTTDPSILPIAGAGTYGIQLDSTDASERFKQYGTYALHWRKLATVKISSADADGVRYWQVVVHWPGGPIDQDWVRPDGQDLGYTFDTAAAQTVVSLDFVSDTAVLDDISERRQLQDYQAYEQLVDSADITNYANDFAVMYFDYAITGETTKKYARIDTHAAASWPSGNKSLQVKSDVFQIYEFADAPTVAPTASDKFMIKDVSPDEPNVGYVTGTDLVTFIQDNISMSGISVACADVAWTDACTFSNIKHTKLLFTGVYTVLNADMGACSDHDGRYWTAKTVNNTAEGATGTAADGDTKDYYTIGEVRANVFTIFNSNANTWSAAAFTVDVTATVALTADTTIDLSSGGSMTLATTVGGSDLNLAPLGDLQINGTAGYDSVADGAVVIDGTTLTFKKGILVNVT